MKYIVLVLLLVGCNEAPDNSPKNVPKIESNKDFYRKVCIENVVYIKAYRRMTVYINSKTLKPVRCSSSTKNK